MKTIAKAALGALALAAAGMAAAAPAEAAASFGFSFGTGPAYGYYGYGPRGYARAYDPCYGPYAYRYAYCGYPLYRGRIFIGGAWRVGPYRYRYYRGYPQFWWRGGWHRGEWDRRGPGFRRFR